MAPYYRALITVYQQTPTSPIAPTSPTIASRQFQIPMPEDKTLLEKMEKANKEELDKLDERLAEAEKTEGEMEIADALRARANYLTRIGDKVRVFSSIYIGISILKLLNLCRIDQERLRSLLLKKLLVLDQKSTLFLPS